MRGYDKGHRIIYGAGRIVETGRLEDAAATLLEEPRVAYLHLRLASNNCYQVRVDRAA